MSLIGLGKRRTRRDAAEALYAQAVAQARLPAFYTALGVPDTLDGRFELIAIHVFLLLERLRREGRAGRALAQDLFDVMFDDMDGSLRELGVGDLGVGPRVKQMARALYGRIAAYEEGLKGSDEVLAAALARNLFGTVEASPESLAGIAAYLRREAARLAEAPKDGLFLGRAAFAPPLSGPHCASK